MRKLSSPTKKTDIISTVVFRVAFLAIILTITFLMKSFSQTNPTSVNCMANSFTQITINWSGSSGATYYCVQEDKQAAFSGSWGTETGIVFNNSVNAPTTTYVYSNGLSAGQTYYAHVASVISSWGWSGTPD